MANIAWKNLSRERGRFALSVFGVTFAVLLVLLLGGLYQGWQYRITEYIESAKADLWVGQEGAVDMSHSVSLLPENTETALQSIVGVREVYPFVGRRIVFPFEGREEHLSVVGYDPSTGIGGPVRLVEGRKNLQGRELIIDRVFAKETGLAVGDTLTLIGGESWTVAGIAEGGNQVLYTFAFGQIDEVRRLLAMSGLVNYFIVQTEPGADRASVASSIEQQLPVQATGNGDFVEENKKIITETFLPIVAVLLIIAFAIGAAIVGLTIYTATVEKASEYGVLKAVGFTGRNLYTIVLTQSLIASLLGYVIGLGLALPVAKLAESIEPSFITLFRVQDLLLVLAGTLLMAGVASWAPAHRIARIDPASVFRA
ncbi:MAG: ABC transporter permease [Candidatus Kerfeldbacteria bacterium]|nr:ABC transporter permease [Candidatus Kerfeldbacteria bacterium]